MLALSSRIGLSRHSALGVARSLARTRPLSITGQAAALALGSGLIGIAVALLVEADFGLAPYDVLSSGISAKTGLSLGQAGWMLAAILFGVAALLRRPPSAWGIAFVFLNGLAIDAASEILQHPSSIVVRLLFVPAGIFVMAAGVTVVVHSGTTGGPFELLMAAGHDRGRSRIAVRYSLDVGVLVLGLVLGGSAGPTTVLYGLCMGIFIIAMSQAVEDYREGRARRSDDPSSDPSGPGVSLSSQPVQEVPALLHSRHRIHSSRSVDSRGGGARPLERQSTVVGAKPAGNNGRRRHKAQSQS